MTGPGTVRLLAIPFAIAGLACASLGGSDPEVDPETASYILFGVYAQQISVKHVVIENVDTGDRHKLRRDKKNDVIFAAVPPGRYYSRRVVPARSDLQAIRLERPGPPIELKPRTIYYVGDITVHTRGAASGMSLWVDIGFGLAQATVERAKEGYPDEFERCELMYFGTQQSAPVSAPE